MLDSLTFGMVLIIVATWVLSWGLITAVVASSRNADPVVGLVQGMMFGPVGVLFVALGGTSTGDAPKKVPPPRIPATSSMGRSERKRAQNDMYS